jgi:hypothetical protein
MGNQANDKFKIYFAEKIWEMIPAFYREEDGLAENPGVLRSIVEIVAEQAAYLRRSNDRLWDDQFVDLCDSWAIPYIADLVGTRLVSSLNLRGRRVDVAKTIYYRRRKGTLRVLEELIGDIAGWDGVVVEEFRRLARTFHGLDPMPPVGSGRFTLTPAGGFADLRPPRGAELADGPFDEYFHSADLRKQHGRDGRYNIPKLGFHLYRLPSRELHGVVPMTGPDNLSFTFDPSGRDVPLFMRRGRGEDFDWDAWRSSREWELSAPMRCRVLGHAEYVITEALIHDLIENQSLSQTSADALRKMRNITFTSEAALRQAIGALSNDVIRVILQDALVADCGKSVLLAKSVLVETAPVTKVKSDRITAGNLTKWTVPPATKRLVIDPERGRMRFRGRAPSAALRVGYHYGFSAGIGAGSYDRSASIETPTVPVLLNSSAVSSTIHEREIAAGTSAARGVTQIGDSSTFGPVENKSGIQNAQVQAENFERPYLRLASDLVLDGNTGSLLTIEGLWIGGAGAFSLVLRGVFEQVTIRHCTLDPGGIDAQNKPIYPLGLVIQAAIQHLVIDHSITGPVSVQSPGVVEKLTVQDSIVQSINPAVAAIDMPTGEVEMFRTTVFGAIKIDRLNASEALIVGQPLPGSPPFPGSANVTDTQNGCFRFSAALEGSRVPHPYESHFIKDTNHFFTSRIFGQPGYAQLSETALQGLLTGAENGSEIGAFSSLLNPIRLEGLRAKVDEFMPFGLIPVFIFET